jgi:hypothetical protein
MFEKKRRSNADEIGLKTQPEFQYNS